MNSIDEYKEVIRQTLFDWHKMPWEMALMLIDKHELEIQRDFDFGIVANIWIERLYLEWQAQYKT